MGISHGVHLLSRSPERTAESWEEACFFKNHLNPKAGIGVVINIGQMNTKGRVNQCSNELSRTNPVKGEMY